jgi:hypothetical protein
LKEGRKLSVYLDKGEESVERGLCLEVGLIVIEIIEI